MANYKYIYVMKDLRKVYAGGKEVLKGIYLSFLPDAKIGVLGHNGAGKSTLLKIMAGIDKDFRGEAWAAEGVRIGYLSQEPKLDEDKTVYENIVDALGEVKNALEEFNTLSLRFMEELSDDEMTELLDKQGELQEKIDAMDGWNLERTVEIAMDALRCPPKDSNVNNLSGGERRRVALCKLLLEKPEILLLDEPTNHLDAESVAWLERFLREYKGMVMLVTHDRYFLNNVTNWILELDRGEGIPYQGNYTDWLLQKEKRLSQEEKEETARSRVLKQELAWVQASPKARQIKNKARIKAYEELLSQENERVIGQAQIVIPNGQRLGNTVIVAEGLCKSFGDKYLIDNLSFRLPAGAIVGVIGANGAGKSTLMKMFTGVEKPDYGSLTIGDTVQLSFVDQSRDNLDDNKTVWQEISEDNDEIILGKFKMPSRAYVSQFNFKGGDQQKKVDQLSGGERNRVHMAKMLKSGGNVLLLDEPTNDLDVDTLRALEESLLSFAGCCVVVSHDRWFLDRIATHILAFEGDSHVEWFEGNYQDYEDDRKLRLGIADGVPKPIKYKPLTR